MQSCHPLAGVARWVNERGLALDIRLLGAADPEPRTAEWVRLDRLPERVPALLADLTVRTCAGHRTSAAAILASDAARQVAGFAAVAAYLVGRVPDLAAVRLWVRVAESGRPAALALRQGDVAMLAGDPMARRPGAVPLPDDDALDGWLAAAAVRTLEPVFQAIRAESRFGLRPQWSMLADALFRALPAAADEVGADQSAAWQRAGRMAARLNDDAPRVRPRQRPFPIRLPGRPASRPERLVLVRGGCCFRYRYKEPCKGCPLISDEQRERRLLARYAPAGGGEAAP
ncbi:hypothetical protein [Marinitenerispora sediminis]|uniref:hypothetical protein n=1 Tax=Marinitenerispora sediminis TaxID=1931232 RepID=UPI000DF3925E|nr:hypothetical protein [Marinitenerispora sediminis]RCV52283.1 hypothetical protein DEF28_13225 [Marinitenerispora sediminis]RCV58823.1 hypothetical protein DEF23_08100 [Marinitenerispora sediminis]